MNMFDFYENCTLALFQEHAFDGESGIRPGSNTAARLVIVGFGQMGESVLLQGARIGHFANGKKLRATVIHPQSARLKQSFYRRYPNFDKTCETQFLNFEFESAEIVEKVAQWRAEQSTVLTFAVCCDDDTRSMTTALALKSQLKERPTTILVRMSSTSGLTSLLSNITESKGKKQRLAGDTGSPISIPSACWRRSARPTACCNPTWTDWRNESTRITSGTWRSNWPKRTNRCRPSGLSNLGTTWNQITKTPTASRPCIFKSNFARSVAPLFHR